VTNAAVRAAGDEVEKLPVSTGWWFGWLVVGLATLAVAALLAGDPVSDREAIAITLQVALVTWLTLIRPRVVAHANGVVLRNMLRDIFVPWSKIERCRVVQTLHVVTDEAAFHGLGVSRSARAIAKQSYGRSSMVFPGSGAGSFGAEAGPRAMTGSSVHPPTEIAYQDYIENVIRDRARDARPDDLRPVTAWAWEAVAALVVASALLVAVLA
jgi:hypothetical protein